MAASVWEIVNPSDAYTIAGDFLPCAVAVLCLGEGKYGMRSEEDGARGLPVFLLGGADEWIRESVPGGLESYLELEHAAIASALASVRIGSREDRKRMDRVLAVIADSAEREKAEAAWHDERRSSMNDIGARAKAMARQLRSKPAASARGEREG